LCGPGLFCCNASCGICVSPGQSCPGIGCGTGGSTGVGGFGGGPSCGTFGSCMAQLASACPERGACVCGGCLCEVAACQRDPGCQQIIGCVMKTNCSGPACYTPQTCQSIIDRYGLNSPSVRMAIAIDNCGARSGCQTRCSVDAGPACASPPPPAPGPIGCMNSSTGSECYSDCRDAAMNNYLSKCANGTCSCYYNGRQTCMCPMTSPNGLCSSCCPAWR
jgi:hypothetical protein